MKLNFGLLLALLLPLPGLGQSGLKGEYFRGAQFDRKVLTRVDTEINFNWDNKSPAPGMPFTDYSIRWTGRIQAPESGEYVFSAIVDDGIRLWVGGIKVIDAWGPHDHESVTGKVMMRKGELYDIKVEYFNGILEGQIQLNWRLPSKAKKSLFDRFRSKMVPVSRKYFSPPPMPEPPSVPEARPVEAGPVVLEGAVKESKFAVRPETPQQEPSQPQNPPESEVPLAPEKLPDPTGRKKAVPVQKKLVRPALKTTPTQAPSVMVKKSKPAPAVVKRSGDSSPKTKIPSKLSSVAPVPAPVKVVKKPPMTQEMKKVILKYTPQNVLFVQGESTIMEESLPELDRLADLLRRFRYLKVRIDGHTDITGDSAINMQLSKDRADEVAYYLEEKGIAPSRIRTRGFGATRPLFGKDSTRLHPRNRRVEFTIR